MAAEFPDLHHSINSLPAVLGSMLEIERAVKLIVEGCLALNNDRDVFERTLITQLSYRLPLGWDMFGEAQIMAVENLMNRWHVLYLVIGRHDYRSNDPAALRLKIKLPDHPVVLRWASSPVVRQDRSIAPSHLHSENHY